MIRLRYIGIVNGVAMGLKWVFRCLFGLIIALSVDLQQGYAQRIADTRLYATNVVPGFGFLHFKKMVIVNSAAYLFCEDGRTSRPLPSGRISEIAVLKVNSNLDSVALFRTGIYGLFIDACATPDGKLAFLLRTDDAFTPGARNVEMLAAIDTNGINQYYYERRDTNGLHVPNKLFVLPTGELVVSGMAGFRGQQHAYMYAALFDGTAGELWRNYYLTQIARPMVVDIRQNRNNEILLFYLYWNELSYVRLNLSGSLLSDGLIYRHVRPSAAYESRQLVLPDSSMVFSIPFLVGTSLYNGALLRVSKDLQVLHVDTVSHYGGDPCFADTDSTYISFWTYPNHIYRPDSGYLTRVSMHSHRPIGRFAYSYRPIRMYFDNFGVFRNSPLGEVISSSFYAGTRITRFSGYGNLTPSPPLTRIEFSFNSTLHVTAYPNPIISTVKLTGLPPDRVYDYVVTSVTGQAVAAGRYKPDEALDLSRLVAGVYMLRLSAGHAVSYVRLVKE